MNKWPFVISIAGFDPSGGAGLPADVKTFESLECYGLAVNTANTIQNAVKFEACHWTSEAVILQQLELLLESFPVELVKIGIIENLQVLNRVIKRLLSDNKNIKIIWDPVLKSSSGFLFQEPREFHKNLDTILENVYVVTPNFEEIKLFYPGFTMGEKIKKISQKTNLYLKGGHRTQDIGLDELYIQNGKLISLKPGRLNCSEKHGSGCVLSAALTANLALGNELPEAAKRAKAYIEKVLVSNQTLLGYHKL